MHLAWVLFFLDIYYLGMKLIVFEMLTLRSRLPAINNMQGIIPSRRVYHYFTIYNYLTVTENQA